MRTLFLMIFVVFVIAVLAFGGWTWVALHWAYSDGERAGYVQKFSRKGWLCKTWEGEIALVNLPGTASEVFPFSVRDPEVAAQVERSMGHRAVLHYEEHRGLPTTCFGETNHFITGVRLADQPDAKGALP